MDDAIYYGEWVIALSAAGKFLGKLEPVLGGAERVRLAPVYEVMMGQATQNGQQAVIRQLLPILLIPVDIGITLPSDVCLIHLAGLPDVERDTWFEMLRNVRAGMQQLRAQRSGILVPGR